MSMELAAKLATESAKRGKTYRHTWTSKSSKTPHHLRFGNGGVLSYMRDGIVLTSTGTSGTYVRLLEFGGTERDLHTVQIEIACDVFDGDKKLSPI